MYTCVDRYVWQSNACDPIMVLYQNMFLEDLSSLAFCLQLSELKRTSIKKLQKGDIRSSPQSGVASAIMYHSVCPWQVSCNQYDKTCGHLFVFFVEIYQKKCDKTILYERSQNWCTSFIYKGSLLGLTFSARRIVSKRNLTPR